jgi:hypothetical protein
MTTNKKKAKIKSLVNCQLKVAIKQMRENIDRALNSGAIDIDGWDENISRMVLPNTIVVAILEDASSSSILNGRGTKYEKRVKREVKNIRYFI